MAPHGKELSEDLKKRIVALHKDGVGYKKIAKTLELSCSMVAKTIQWFKRTGSTQNRPRHGRPKKLNTCAQRHIQRLCLGNRRMSAASIAAELERVGGQPDSAQTICRTLHQTGLHGYRPRRMTLLKMMQKKACKQFAKDKQTKDMDYWNHDLWSDETKIHFQMVSIVCGGNQVRSSKTSVSCLQLSMVVGLSWSGAAWLMPTCTVTYWSWAWSPPFEGQYSMAPNTHPRQPLPC